MTWFQGFLEDALRASSLKFLYYIVKPRRHPFERLFWLVWCCCLGSGAACFSWSTWNRYKTNPTVISMERNYLDWNTSFPAFTICPVPKLEQAPAYGIAYAKYPNNVEHGINFLKSLANWTYPDLGQVPEDLSFKPLEYLQLLLDITSDFNHSLPEIPSFKDAKGLSMIMTEMGICYSFNSQLAHYLDPRYWLSKNWSLGSTIPLLQGNPIDEAELSVQANDIKRSFNVYIHDSEEIIDASANMMFPVGTKEAMYLDIFILPIISTDETKKLSVDQRKCRFIEESNLETSPAYSYRLCRAECRMRLSYRLCGCVPYFYRDTGNYKVCGPSGMNCLLKYKDSLLKLSDRNKREICNCLPNCNSANIWTSRVLQSAWNRDTVFRLAFDSYPRYRLKRDVVFGFWDMLAQMGGVACLCFGCSVLSGFEVIYIFSLRLYFFWRKG